MAHSSKKSAPKALTQRQLQSEKAAREKAARIAREIRWRRIRIVGGITGTVGVVVISGWLWSHGGIAKVAQDTANRFYAMTAHAGFTVQASYLEGRNRTTQGEIAKALSFKKGDPILALSLDELRTRLESIPTVKTAAVERALPHSLHIKIVEREPVAIWQYKNQLSLIDDQGTVMHDLSLDEYRSLPIVVGQGAPDHVEEAIAILAREPDLKPLVQAMVRVSDRRWNVRLRQGIEVKLPEMNPVQAWEKIASLQRDQQLLMRDIRAIDMRNGEDVTVKLAPEPLPAATPMSAKNLI